MKRYYDINRVRLVWDVSKRIQKHVIENYDGNYERTFISIPLDKLIGESNDLDMSNDEFFQRFIRPKNPEIGNMLGYSISFQKRKNNINIMIWGEK